MDSLVPGVSAAILFGLASALSWGAGDFCGGLATRRAPALPVLAITEASGLALLLALALATGEPLPTAGMLGWSALAGLAGLLGLSALYRGLATGSAAVVAPTSAVIAAAIPVIVTAISVGPPGPLTIFGLVVGLLGIWLVAGGQARGGSRSSYQLALLAGLGFGAYFMLLDRALDGAAFWPTAAARATALVVVLGVLAAQRGARGAEPAAPTGPRVLGLAGSALAIALLGGVLDAGGNGLFALASQAGRLDIAAVLSSMYPATTVLLGRAVLGERISATQGAGLVATLAAIALIAR